MTSGMHTEYSLLCIDALLPTAARVEAKSIGLNEIDGAASKLISSQGLNLVHASRQVRTEH